MVVLVVALSCLPFVAVGALAVFVTWRRHVRFGGCCTPPEKGRVWMCAHRRTWHRLVWAGREEWRRVTKRRYVRLAMAELSRDIEKATGRGSKF